MSVKASTKLMVIGLCLCLSGNAVSKSTSDSQDFMLTSMLIGMFTSGPTTVMTLDITDEIKKLKNWIFVQNDAAAFVATDGAIRGPFLDSALELLRENKALDDYSDIQLTHALLAG